MTATRGGGRRSLAPLLGAFLLAAPWLVLRAVGFRGDPLQVRARRGLGSCR